MNTEATIQTCNTHSSPSDQCGNDFWARRRPWKYSYASNDICSTDNNNHFSAGRCQHKEMIKNGKVHSDIQDQALPTTKKMDLSWLPRSTQTVEELVHKSSTPRKSKLKNESTRKYAEPTYKQNQSVSRQSNVSLNENIDVKYNSKETIPVIDLVCQKTRRSDNVTKHRVRPSVHHSSLANHNRVLEDSEQREISSDAIIDSSNSYQSTQCCVKKGKSYCRPTFASARRENISHDVTIENRVKLKASAIVSSNDLPSDATYKTLRRTKWTVDGKNISSGRNSNSSRQYSLDVLSSNTVLDCDENKIGNESRYNSYNNHLSEMSEQVKEQGSEYETERSIASYQNRPSSAFSTCHNHSNNSDISCAIHDNSRTLTPIDQCSSPIDRCSSYKLDSSGAYIAKYDIYGNLPLKQTEYNFTGVPTDGNISVNSIHSKSTNDNVKCDVVSQPLNTEENYLNSGSNAIISEKPPIFSTILNGSNKTSVQDNFESDQISKISYSISDNDNLISSFGVNKLDSGIRPKDISSQYNVEIHQNKLVSYQTYPDSTSFSFTSGNNLLSKLSEVSRMKLTSLMNALKSRQRATMTTHDQTSESTLEDRPVSIARNDEEVCLNTSESLLKEEQLKGENTDKLQDDFDKNNDRRTKHCAEIEQITDLYLPKQSTEDFDAEISNDRCPAKFNMITSNGESTSSSNERSKDKITLLATSRPVKNDLLCELQRLSTRLKNLQDLSAGHVPWQSNTSNNNCEENGLMKSENIMQELRPFDHVHSSVRDLRLSEHISNTFLPNAFEQTFNEIFIDDKPSKFNVKNESTNHRYDKKVPVEPSLVFQKVALPDYPVVVTDRLIENREVCIRVKSTDDTDKVLRHIYTSHNAVDTYSLMQCDPTINGQLELDSSVDLEANSHDDPILANDCDIIIKKSSQLCAAKTETSPAGHSVVAPEVDNVQSIQFVIDNKCDNLNQVFLSSGVISASEEDEVTDTSVAAHFVRTTNGIDYNDPILPTLTKKRLQTKKIRDKLLRNQCHSLESDVSDDSVKISRKFTDCSFTSKKKRKRSSPIGQLLKSYLHQASSSDVEIDGLEVTAYLKAL